MSDRKIFMLIGAMIALACLGGVGWLLMTYERVEIEVNRGVELEVRRNPYLGVERYFEALQIEVETLNRWENGRVLEDKDVVMVDPSVVIFSTWAPEVLQGWVEDGGHLILLGPEFDDEESRNDEFLESLGLSKVDFQGYQSIQKVEEIGIEYEALGAFVQYVTYPDEVDFLAFIETNITEPIVASAAREKGRVTVIFDKETVTTRVAKGDLVGMKMVDTGQLLADVLALQPQWPDEIMLSPERQSQDWMDIVWKRGWPFFVGLILLFLVGLTRGRRFGPSIAEPDRRRRRRAEHVEATGRFLWHRNGSEILIRASRRALLAAIARRRPSIRTLKPAQRYRLMAEELQVSEEEIQHLMASSQPLNRSEGFRELIARLEELRRKL